MAQILSGKEAAPEVLGKLQQAVKEKGTRPAGLAIVQVGNDPASASYIRQKKAMAEKNSIQFEHVHLDPSVSKDELFAKITELKNREDIDALLIQLPLDSKDLSKPEITKELLEHLGPEKDADGLHATNQGRLFTGESTPQNWSSPLPCTALGVIRLLNFYNIPLEGKHAVVIGRSRLVGQPVSTLLTQANATVTLCHSRTKNLADHCKSADLIVVAAGKKHILTADMISDGAVLVDVGIHADEIDGKRKLSGDIHPDCYEKAAAYSPVPGGVGPMTVATLIENTLRLYLSKLS